MESREDELTESVHHKICEALRIGATYELAARYAGISPRLFWRWKKQGERATGLLEESDRQRRQAFCQDIQKARADYEMSCLMKMEKLGSQQWRPLQWKYGRLLEIRWQSQRKKKKPKKQKKRKTQKKFRSKHDENA